MANKFSMEDYVDVPERLRQFHEAFPEGTLQGEGEFVRDAEGQVIGYVYSARAYRTADDARPGVGTAYEPIPGRTTFTKDSEVMNAETSAWGRAIVALGGFVAKTVASTNEVLGAKARSGDESVDDQLAAAGL